MKQTLFVLALVAAMAGCNSGGNGDSTEDTTGSNIITPVENVNGNLPDTTNSITLDDDGADTTRTRDSIRK